MVVPVLEVVCAAGLARGAHSGSDGLVALFLL